MDYIILTKEISKKYYLKNKDKITTRVFFEISGKEKIDLHDLILILGINKNNEKKLKEKTKCKMQINLDPIEIKTIKDVKHAIKLIKIDLKYLEQYKERYYTKKEIEEICKKYNVKFMWFIKYIYPRKKNYLENLEILENSKNGLWIGEKRNIEEKFLIDNYHNIQKTCTYVANDINKIYNCHWLKEDLEFEAFISILKNGLIQKNFEYDNKYMLNKLKYNARFQAFKFLTNKLKEKSYEEILEDENNNKEKIQLLDNTYNPLEMIQNEMNLENIEIEDIHKEIISKMKEEIYKNTEKENILKNIAKELKMQRKVLNNYIETIQKIIIYNGLVKVCKNGQIIMMYEED